MRRKPTRRLHGVVEWPTQFAFGEASTAVVSVGRRGQRLPVDVLDELVHHHDLEVARIDLAGGGARRK
jgi:hypothetical protein